MKRAIISGYFNSLSSGRLDLIEAAAKLGDKLVVIVNNDNQQVLKRGKIILDEQNRVRIMRALHDVDDVVLSIDQDPTVMETLRLIAEKYKGDELIFANGGDRSSDKVVPESAVCEELGIEMRFGVGGEHEYDSSSTYHAMANEKTSNILEKEE